MSAFDRTIQLVAGELTIVDMAILYPSQTVTVTSSLPAWFINNVNGGGQSLSWNITAPIDGVYVYNLQIVVDEPPANDGTLTLNVEFPYTDVEVCCDENALNIVWFNRQGGYGNFIFNEKKEYNVEVGDEVVYISNGLKKYAERGKIYNGVKVYVSGLTKTQIDGLDSLRYSIQAWIYNADQTFTEIIFASSDFVKYNTRDNFYTLEFDFQYSEYLNIQTQ